MYLLSQSHLLELKTSWVIDSGCTYHACNDRSRFKNFATTTSPITLADGKVIQTSGRGTVDSFDNVNYVPQFRFNLLSVKCLNEIGYLVAFTQQFEVYVEKGDEKILLGKYEKGMYLTDSEYCDQLLSSTSVATVFGTALISQPAQKPADYIPAADLLHQRWGHAQTVGNGPEVEPYRRI